MDLRHACEAMSDVTQHLGTWLSRQPGVGEESATDWLLFELSEQIPWIQYRKFNRFQEARTTGADWDWWFVDHDFSLALTVQAKKVSGSGDNYPALAYSNRYGLQLEKLRERARNENLLPFYCLYHRFVWEDIMCRGRRSGEDGAFLAAADSLYNDFVAHGRRPVSAQDLLVKANPLSCILCCPLVAQNRAARVRDVYQYLRSYYPEAFDHEATNGREEPGLHAEPPAYVRVLLEAEDVAPEWFETEFRVQLPDTDALVVVDLTRRMTGNSSSDPIQTDPVLLRREIQRQRALDDPSQGL